jgi:alpha-amylase/alpha-mannosidase (GH57 family)
LSSRHLIIHGHFYQPPRENPWLSTIEPQLSAAPFENWNFRINRECYAPNARARLMGAGGIKGFFNNYEYMSFNFGPTLLSWLEKFDPETLAAIVAADRRAAAARDGHGPALAQVYNHIIMPLADPRDRLTQIRWGLADFERRFGRRPEGMWLAETAVDLATLEMLAREGLKFTVLAQNQARAVRPLSAAKPRGAGRKGKETAWLDVSGGRVDPREPYRVFWGRGSGDYLDVFFYDGPVSRAIAFERLLGDGAALLARVEEAFGQARDDGGPRLVNLATDGESYGHHFTFGEMALAWVFDRLSSGIGGPEAIELTNYGHYLAQFPPAREARIFDNSSWSCAHGVERWRDDCGCNTGGGGGTWNQKWRRPLREGLDWLRDRLAEIFEKSGGRLLKDPWRARDEYIKLVLNGYEPKLREDFLAAHGLAAGLDPQGRRQVWALLEAQLMSLYMFTSCGWFFDEVSGLEPVQNLRYALRAIELAEPLAGTGLREGFLAHLDLIRPNIPAYATGREVWRQAVESGRLSPGVSAAHWAAAALLEVSPALDSFEEDSFQPRAQIVFQDDRQQVLAGVVDLIDRRLERTTSHLCLARHIGGPHPLDLWVADLEAEFEIPAWLNQETLARMSAEDRLAELMPDGTACFGWADLLPGARRQLVHAVVKRALAEVRAQAEEFHQLTLSPEGTVTPPADWAEGFLHRAASEAIFSRLLSPGPGRLDFEALAEFAAQGWLNGPAQFQAELRDLGDDFLDKAFRDLAGNGPLRPVLDGLVRFLKIVNRADGLGLDLWASQNRWLELADDKRFRSGLDLEEKELLRELGLTLGFTALDWGEAEIA